MKLSIWKVVPLCAVLMLGVVACRDEVPADDGGQSEMTADVVSTEDYTGEVLDVGFRIALPQQASVVDAGTETVSRSLRENGAKEIHFDYDNMRDVFIHVCLQNGDDVQSRSYATLEGHIVKDASGTYSVEIPDPYIRLREGRLTGTGWKACALLETAERSDAQRFFGVNRYSSRVNTDRYFSAGSGNMAKNLSQLTTPLYSRYAPVSTQGRRTIVNLNFDPLGTIIRLNVQNTLAMPIYVNRIKVKNKSIKRGNANVTLGVEENGMLKFDFGVQASGTASNSNGGLWFADEVSIWNVNSAKVEQAENFYLWCIPVDAAVYEYNQVELVYSTSTSYSEASVDSVLLDKSPNPVRMQSGYYYSMDAPLKESDLMISEMLHFNPLGYNYTVIEIYNPTNKAIDIRNYGLCRVLKWDATNPVIIGEASSLPQPMGNALVQDLFVTSFSQPVYRFDGKLAQNTYQGKNRYYDMYGTHINKDARYMLQPGKTVVLVAGQIRERLAASYLREQYNWPTGSLMYNTPYLANAVKMGYCQYAAAVDNGITMIDYATAANSGVMQHGFNHVMVLVKKKAGGGGYEAVDWLFSACRRDLVNLLQSKALPEGNYKDDHLFVARKESVMYPVSKRDNDMYLHSSKSHLPLGESIFNISETYQFYDWYYHFTQQPREYYSEMYMYMTPGTRFFRKEVENNLQWMPGAYNETGKDFTPNNTTGK